MCWCIDVHTVTAEGVSEYQFFHTTFSRVCSVETNNHNPLHCSVDDWSTPRLCTKPPPVDVEQVGSLLFFKKKTRCWWNHNQQLNKRSYQEEKSPKRWPPTTTSCWVTTKACLLNVYDVVYDFYVTELRRSRWTEPVLGITYVQNDWESTNFLNFRMYVYSKNIEMINVCNFCLFKLNILTHKILLCLLQCGCMNMLFTWTQGLQMEMN